MNVCIIMGKIISNIQFDFILNSKNDSIAKFKLELSNNSIVNVIAYNQKADYCYRNLKINDKVIILSEISNGADIIIREIYKI